MIKPFAAVSIAAVLAALAVTAPGLTPQVQAHLYAIKGDRLDAKTYGPACSERGWPYFEASCLRDMTTPNRQARPVRMVGTERPTALVAANKAR